jgi:hypothetical protein
MSITAKGLPVSVIVNTGLVGSMLRSRLAKAGPDAPRLGGSEQGAVGTLRPKTAAGGA